MALNKRPAVYVPDEQRRELNRLSKADLMELLWDFAMIATGEADRASPEEVYGEIVGIHETLRFNGLQGNVKLKGATQ